MKYILDSSGYVENASCNPISCDDKVSQEYTGTIPDGYDSLDDWILNANIRAYKISGGNLVYDSARDAELTALWAQYDCMGRVLFEGNSTGTITLNDSVNNYEYIEIFFKQHEYTAIFSSVKVYHPWNVQAGLVAIQSDGNGAGIASAYVVIKDKTITKASKNIYWTNGGNQNKDVIYITRVIGYK